jgi:phage shock protein A
MPFRWRDIFGRENDLAKAATTRAVEDHANPHDVIAVTIRDRQDKHDELEASVAQVLANYNQSKDRLEADLTLQAKLDRLGRAAHAAGHDDDARQLAMQLQQVNERLGIEQTTFDNAKTAADQAKAAFEQNGRDLQAAMAKAKSLDMIADQAAMQDNINQAMKAVHSATSHETPSLDVVEERIRGSLAKAQAGTELQALDPSSSVSASSALATGEADDILSQWDDQEPQKVDAVVDRPALPKGSPKAKPPRTSVAAEHDDITDKLFK